MVSRACSGRRYISLYCTVLYSTYSILLCLTLLHRKTAGHRLTFCMWELSMRSSKDVRCLGSEGIACNCSALLVFLCRKMPREAEGHAWQDAQRHQDDPGRMITTCWLIGLQS